MKRRDNIDYAVERIRNAVKDETSEKIMVAMIKLAFNDQMSVMEDWLNREWNSVCLLLDQSDIFNEVIRYHAQLDMLNEIYCHFFTEYNDDESYYNISRAADDLANKQIKKIQHEMTIYSFGMFE